MKKAKDVDEYIQMHPAPVQLLLHQLRAIIKKAAPKAEEVISYGMPAYKQEGALVYFAAHKNHIGFYPMPSSIAEFEEEVKQYKHAKGSIQFPLDKPLPVKLITKIVKFRVEKNLVRAYKKKLPKDKTRRLK
jgi:uncharacterized protein YdhG (YjbR/CyaY superfamily)